MFKSLLLVAVVSLAMLSGCSTIDAVLSPNPNVVATMEASLAAADNIALAYVQLPKCGSVAAAGSKVCSDATIVKNIGIAATDAYTAVKAAKANETGTTVEAAQNAVTAFQTITSSLQ